MQSDRIQQLKCPNSSFRVGDIIAEELYLNSYCLLSLVTCVCTRPVDSDGKQTSLVMDVVAVVRSVSLESVQPAGGVRLK